MGSAAEIPPRPATPLAISDLLVNAEGQPNIGSELRSEIPSANSVDLICAFVIWSGVRHLRDSLAALVDRGGRLRVITTTYMGATEKRAVDELVAIGADVKVALDARTTKLHAKAWLLERDAGLSTAFVGSSNLSHTALFDGLEWNVRLSVGRCCACYRSDSDDVREALGLRAFRDLRPGLSTARSWREALREHDRRSLGEASTISLANLDVRPYPHQERMLEALTIERERHDRHSKPGGCRYRHRQNRRRCARLPELCASQRWRPSLLFVAHREEILRQSLATYRAVLRDGSFGEIHGGGRVAEGNHVFAMIQSLHGSRLEEIDPDAFDVLVVDEFHHAAASELRRLLNHLGPRNYSG